MNYQKATQSHSTKLSKNTKNSYEIDQPKAPQKVHQKVKNFKRQSDSRQFNGSSFGKNELPVLSEIFYDRINQYQDWSQNLEKEEADEVEFEDWKEWRRQSMNSYRSNKGQGKSNIIIIKK